MVFIVISFAILIFYLIIVEVIKIQNKKKYAVIERLKRYNLVREEKILSLKDQKLAESFKKRIITPIINRVSLLINKRISVSSKEKLKRDLLMAGEPGNIQPDEYMAIVWVITGIVFILSLAGMLFFTHKMHFILGLFAGCIVLGRIIPKFWLGGRIKNRLQLIARELPDFLDLLTVTVEAGLGFDTAMQKLVQKSRGVLANEFNKTLKEINMGISRREALKNMTDRAPVETLENFVTSIIQAEQLGVSIGNVLRTQSNQIRIKRRQLAEELAQKLPIKMMIPMVLFILPVLLIVAIGPVVIHVMKEFANQ